MLRTWGQWVGGELEKYEPMGARPMAPYMACAPRPQVSRWPQKEGSSFIPIQAFETGPQPKPWQWVESQDWGLGAQQLGKGPGRKVDLFGGQRDMRNWRPTGVGWPEERAWQRRAG